jgi:hypothetical protein
MKSGIIQIIQADLMRKRTAIDDGNYYSGSKRLRGEDGKYPDIPGMNYRTPEYNEPPERKGSGSRIHAEDAFLFPQELSSIATKGVIHSNGRGQPMMQQSSIVLQVAAPKTIYDQRARNQESDMLVPLGARENMTIVPGNILLQAIGKAGQAFGRSGRQRGIQGFGDIEVVDAVNGCHRRKDRFRFAGIAATATSATDMNSDIALTTIIGGTATALNTGPLTLYAGGKVGFFTTPYTVRVGSSVFPAIKQEGMPPMKFRPATYPFDELMSKGLFEKVAKTAMAEVKAEGNDLLGQGKILTTIYRDIVQRALSKSRLVYTGQEDASDDFEYLPVDTYTRYLVAGYLLGLVAATFDVGQGQGHANGADNIMKIISEIYQDETRRANIESGNQFITVRNELPTELNERNYTDVVAFVEARKVGCIADQQAYNDRHLIGTVLSNSPPGAPLDLNVNCR